MLRIPIFNKILALAIVSLWSVFCPASENALVGDIERLLAEEGLIGIAWTLVDEDGGIRVGSAGLNDAFLWQLFSERAHPDAPLTAAFPDPAVQLRVRSRPGSRFSYSNMGYTVLGMIIETVVGSRYETYLDENFLDPLGMHHSTFAFTTQEGETADPRLAWGHVDDGSRYAAAPMFLRPAGQFTTTAADLGRLAAFLMSDGMVGGQGFIVPEMLHAQGRPIGTKAADEGLVAGYALGLGRRDRYGVVGFCHGGNIVGFAAMLCLFPDDHKAFAYSINTDSETANYGRFDQLFIEALSITPAQSPPTGEPSPDISDWYGRYILSPNRFQTFEYLDTLFGAVKVSSDGVLLTLDSLQQEPRLLRPTGDRLYSAGDRTTTSHVLYRGYEGEMLLSDGFRSFERVPAAYLAIHWTAMLLGLSGLVWLLVAGGASLFRHRSGLIRRPVFPAFVTSVLLFAPLPMFFNQSFIALGDLTPASILLAVVTGLLPIGMLSTLVLAIRARKGAWTNRLHGLAAACVLLWSGVLMAAGMLPLRLWA